jgi:hypothetical protein
MSAPGRVPRALASVGFILVGLLAIGWLSGCAHYQLGTGARPGFRTLYVEPVGDTTMLPQSRALVSTQLREAFARDGRIALANSAADADAVLTVVINDYFREVAAAREDDTGLARKFTLTLGVTCTLRDRRASRMLFENRVVTAQRDAFTDGGQLQSEYQTLPLLAESLATKVVRAALDVW